MDPESLAKVLLLECDCVGRGNHLSLASTTWKAMGLDVRGVLRTLWIPVAAAGVAGIAVYLAHTDGALHPLQRPTRLFAHVWGYLIWALMQQFLLQIYFQLRLQRLLPGRILPAVAATVLFALAHLPNPVLTPLTLVWGMIACLLFLHYRNIYALGLAHGLLGLCVAVTVPDSLLHHMRVGIGYRRYHQHGLHHRSQMGPDRVHEGMGRWKRRQRAGVDARHTRKKFRPALPVVRSAS